MSGDTASLYFCGGKLQLPATFSVRKDCRNMAEVLSITRTYLKNFDEDRLQET